MVKSSNRVHIEKFSLSDDELEDCLHGTFIDYESHNWQLGQAWLANLASTALDPTEKAVIYIARLSAEDFVVCPLRLNAGSGQAHALSTFYTSLFSPLASSETPEVLFTELFRYLITVEKLTAITLSPMDQQAPEFDLARRALARSGWKGLHSFFCFGNWIHRLGENTYQSYLAARPSQLRNTVARRTRKFLGPEKGQLQLIQDPDSTESAILQFVAVYNKSWKKEEPYPEFIPQLMRMAAKRGWLRLGIAHYDNKPVASQIWIVANGTAYIFKLAYDESYKRLSPGTVLTAFMMEHVIDADKVTSIDYLSGDDGYKKDWMSVRRERHGLAAYNPKTLRGSAMLIAHILKGLYRRLKGSR